MEHELIDRYIYAATKRMSNKKRNDVSNELRGLIDDMLAERCGDVIPTEHDIRVVLTELGNPYELSEKYASDAKSCLIGAPYYSKYKLVLKIVLACTAFGITLGDIVSFIVDNSLPWYAAAAQWFGMIICSLLTAFGAVTLLFAFFDYKNIKINAYEGIDNLPPVPKKNEKISRAGSVIGICFSLLFYLIFLVFPQIFTIIIEQTTYIPILNIDAIRSSWLIITAFTAFGIIRDAVKLIEGRYNFKVMLSTVISNLCSIILAAFWLLNSKILSDDFLKWISSVFDSESAVVIPLYKNFQIFLLGVIAFALLIDTAEAVIKYFRSRKNAAECC